MFIIEDKSPPFFPNDFKEKSSADNENRFWGIFFLP